MEELVRVGLVAWLTRVAAGDDASPLLEGCAGGDQRAAVLEGREVVAIEDEVVREDEGEGVRDEEDVRAEGGIGRERWRCGCERRMRTKKSAGDLRKTLRVEVEDGRECPSCLGNLGSWVHDCGQGDAGGGSVAVEC